MTLNEAANIISFIKSHFEYISLIVWWNGKYTLSTKHSCYIQV